MYEIKISVTHFDYDHVLKKNVFKINEWFNLSNEMINRGIDLKKIESINVVRDVEEHNILDETN